MEKNTKECEGGNMREEIRVLRKIFKKMNIMIRTKEDMPDKGWYDEYRFLERQRDRYVKKLNPSVGRNLNEILF